MVCAVRPAQAQDDTQLWGEFKFSWPRTHHLTYALDVEPKLLLSKPEGDPGWVALDLTPSLEYRRGTWLDVLGELHLAKTRQTDDLNSTEVTPRIGVRFHVLSTVEDDLHRERRPRHRLVLRNLLRLEGRNLFYSAADKPNSSTLRLRDRAEVQFALTRPRVSDDGAIYATGDAEWFWQLDDVKERFAHKQRLRGGLGYRRSANWQFEGLLIWNRSRNTIDEPFRTNDFVVDLVMKRVW